MACSYQTGVWPRSMLNTAQRWELTAPRAHHCQQALVRLQASVLALGGDTARQNIWLQQQGAVSLLAVNQCWSHGLSFHSGISWVTLGQRFAEVVIGSCPAGAFHPMCSSAESLPLGNCTFFLFPHTMLC